jgi:hypothetical protein
MLTHMLCGQHMLTLMLCGLMPKSVCGAVYGMTVRV